MNRSMILLVAWAAALVGESSYGENPIHNGTTWTDTAGRPISCHDGGISRFGDTFYWYGTSYRGNPRGLYGRNASHLQQGFQCYSSKNLVDPKTEAAKMQHVEEWDPRK